MFTLFGLYMYTLITIAASYRCAATVVFVHAHIHELEVNYGN